MSDNGKELKEEIKDELIQMVIIFNPKTNVVQVSGPLNNRTLSYGMLEMAKEAVYELKEKVKKIEVPKHGIMDFVKRR